jgi:hypothetical protein
MRNNYHNPYEERNIKHLKETIDLLKRENNKLRNDNKVILQLKETINKLKKEKLELSQKLIDYESESFLYNSNKGDKEDILLYNPNHSKKNIKINLEKYNFSFSLKAKKHKHQNSCFSDKNEEIDALKNELIKKEEIISLLKSTNKKIYKPVIINNFSINSSSSTSRINSYANSAQKVMTFKNNQQNSCNYNSILSKNVNSKISNKISSTFSWKEENHLKKKIQKSNKDTPFDDCDSHGSLQKNIFKEIQNILEEKRNFVIKTLTIENFSFDILSINSNNKIKNIKEKDFIDINGFEDIDKLIEIVKKRKIQVLKIKKYFSDKLI